MRKKSNKYPKHLFNSRLGSKKFTTRYIPVQWSILLLLAFIFAGAFIVYKSLAATETNPQTTWAACKAGASPYTPLSDSAAAALVTHQPEIRPYNAKPYTINGVTYPAVNYYVPTDAELAAFQNSKNQYGQTPSQATYYTKFVDGRDGLINPSTDDLIQWGAHKWGIPEDWLRAQYVNESSWSQFAMGDLTTETNTGWFPQFPIQSQVPGSGNQVYESLGISQLKWRPNNSVGSGTEPIRWKSTAFNIDFELAQVRFYYDNPMGLRDTWGDTSYVPCQQWNSLAGWYQPYPWNSDGQLNYITRIQQLLQSRSWETSSFINQTVTFPAVISFNTATTKMGDINKDNSVNILDLSILLSKYGTTDTTADLNHDGVVNISDLSILLSNYGN
jgi:hypothetical protein